MLILLSPAKTLDFEPVELDNVTHARFLDETDSLITTLRSKNAKDLMELMHVSEKIAALNVERNEAYARPLSLGENAKPALLAFQGDVYKGLKAETYSEKELAKAQEKIRILSGLYGVLRPLDLIRPYRLEMGTALVTSEGKNLYQFWGSKLTDLLNTELAEKGGEFIVNLASNEYFKAVKKRDLNGHLITPAFKDWKNGQYKMISFFAKKARGAMADYLVREDVDTLDGLRAFEGLGYKYDREGSTPDAPLFLRRVE